MTAPGPRALLHALGRLAYLSGSREVVRKHVRHDSTLLRILLQAAQKVLLQGGGTVVGWKARSHSRQAWISAQGYHHL